MVFIGDLYPEDVLERNTELLFEVAALRDEKELLERERDLYRKQAESVRRNQ